MVRSIWGQSSPGLWGRTGRCATGTDGRSSGPHRARRIPRKGDTEQGQCTPVPATDGKGVSGFPSATGIRDTSQRRVLIPAWRFNYRTRIHVEHVKCRPNAIERLLSGLPHPECSSIRPAPREVHRAQGCGLNLRGHLTVSDRWPFRFRWPDAWPTGCTKQTKNPMTTGRERTSFTVCGRVHRSTARKNA